MSNAYAQLKQRLDAGEILVLDGATGTELQRRGAPMDPAAWCGPATLHNDDLLTEIHSDYIRAGSDVITANTFASSRLMLGPAGYADRVGEINLRAVEAALRAREQTGTTDRVAVAGALSHMVPVAAGSATVDATKVPSSAEISDAFYELANILRDAGVDHIMLEMMYNPVRAQLALEAALSTGLPVWFGKQQQEAAAARTQNFTADCPVIECCLIELIDMRCCDLIRQHALVTPAFMQQLPEFADRRGFLRQNRQSLINHLPHHGQFVPTLVQIEDLRMGNRIGHPRDTGKAQHQMR